jgi:excisionase family DNA binding protein
MKQPNRITPIDKTWLSNREAASYIGMSADYLKDLRADGILRFYKVRGAIFYRKADVDRLIEKGRIC